MHAAEEAAGDCFLELHPDVRWSELYVMIRLKMVVKLGWAGDGPFLGWRGFDHALVQPAPGGSFARGEHKPYCDQETSKATQKNKDLEAVVAQHTSKLKQPPPDPPHWTASFRWTW